MYSRYTPNASGGFDRRQFPDEADLRAAQGRAPPSPPPHDPVILRDAKNQPSLPDSVILNAAKNPYPPSPGPRRMRFRAAPPRRPRGAGPGLSGSPPLGALLGPEGLLAQLLPHGLDTEDLLVLSILLLSMKQDGASPTELLIAAGLYFWL